MRMEGIQDNAPSGISAIKQAMSRTDKALLALAAAFGIAMVARRLALDTKAEEEPISTLTRKGDRETVIVAHMVQIDPVPVPHFSTYVCKLEAALRDAGIPFQIRKVVRKTLPRGKMPALHWNGRVLTDSQAILDVLAKERVINRHPDSWLNAESRAAANFFRNTIEHLAYHLFTHERWIDQWSLTKETYWPATSTPWFFRFVIADMFVQPDVVSNLSKITGCYSNLEREALVEGVWEDAAALLGNKKYFLSETELSSADYSAFGLLFNILAYKKLNPKSYKAVARHANLVKFVERVKERLYPDVFAK